MDLAIRKARLGGRATANIDTDFEVDSYTGMGSSTLNAGDHDFDARHERADRRRRDRDDDYDRRPTKRASRDRDDDYDRRPRSRGRSKRDRDDDYDRKPAKGRGRSRSRGGSRGMHIRTGGDSTLNLD